MVRHLEFYPESKEDLNEVRRLFRPLSSVSGRLAMIVGEFPPLDVYRTEDGVLLKLEAPGIDPDQVELKARLNEFVISGDRKVESGKRILRQVRLERFHGPFQRALELPFYIDEEEIKADYRDGILTVSLKRSAVPQEEEVFIRPEHQDCSSMALLERAFDHEHEDSTGTRLPYCDILEDRVSYLVCIDLPGVTEADLELQVEDSSFSLYAEPANDHEQGICYHECENGAYKRTFKLSGDIDRSRIDFSLKDGLLKVKLPKKLIQLA